VTTTVAKRLTFEEFELLPDQPGKRELLRGELIELPPAKRKHNVIGRRLFLRLFNILTEAHAHEEARDLGDVYHRMGYHFPDGSWLQPDVSITHAGQEWGDYYLGSPALAVEIVSESNSADEIAGKVEVFLLNGAAEVWVLYPNRQQMWVYGREGRAERHAVTVTSGLLSGATIDLNQILE
jgi:Uma2 family endonuclease